MSSLTPTFNSSKGLDIFNTLFEHTKGLLRENYLVKDFTKESYLELIETGSKEVVSKGKPITLDTSMIMKYSPILSGLSMVVLASTLQLELEEDLLNTFMKFRDPIELMSKTNIQNNLSKYTFNNTLYSNSNSFYENRDNLYQLYELNSNKLLGLLFNNGLDKSKSGDFTLKQVTDGFSVRYKVEKDNPVIYSTQSLLKDKYTFIKEVRVYKENDIFYKGQLLELEISENFNSSSFSIKVPYQLEDDKESLCEEVIAKLDNNDITWINKLVLDRIGVSIYNLSTKYEITVGGLNNINFELESFKSSIKTKLNVLYPESSYEELEDGGDLYTPIYPYSFYGLVGYFNGRPVSISDQGNAFYYQDTKEFATFDYYDLNWKYNFDTMTPYDSDTWAEKGDIYNWQWDKGLPITVNEFVIDELKELVFTDTDVRTITAGIDAKDPNLKIYKPSDLLIDEFNKPNIGTLKANVIGKLFEFNIDKRYKGGHTIRLHIAKSKDYMEIRSEKVNPTSVLTVSDDYTDLVSYIRGIVIACASVNLTLKGAKNIFFENEYSRMSSVVKGILVDKDNSYGSSSRYSSDWKLGKHFSTVNNVYSIFKKATPIGKYYKDRNYQLFTCFSTSKSLKPLGDTENRSKMLSNVRTVSQREILVSKIKSMYKDKAYEKLYYSVKDLDDYNMMVESRIYNKYEDISNLEHHSIVKDGKLTSDLFTIEYLAIIYLFIVTGGTLTKVDLRKYTKPLSEFILNRKDILDRILAISDEEMFYIGHEYFTGQEREEFYDQEYLLREFPMYNELLYSISDKEDFIETILNLKLIEGEVGTRSFGTENMGIGLMRCVLAEQGREGDWVMYDGNYCLTAYKQQGGLVKFEDLFTEGFEPDKLTWYFIDNGERYDRFS